MYIPPSFKRDDFETLAGVIQRYSFATVITSDGETPFASHLPMLFDSQRGTLVGHMARANPQWRHFARGVEVLTIFQGPHAYISPSWYEVAPAVPTWNYVAVHVYGVPRLIEDEAEVADLLRETITLYESRFPHPWPGDLPADYLTKMIRAIVGFEIPLDRIEGKFKLGQNRSIEDQQGVYQTLSTSSSQNDQELAALMAPECRGE